MKSKFETFLHKLKTEDNKALIETIEKGFRAINESYADVREEKVDALTHYNHMASMTADRMGNGVLSFLERSGMENSHLFSSDDEPELDYFPTSEFNQYSDPDVLNKPRDEIEDDLGLTAGDLLELNF